ncbi:MAG: SpoIIE family protein phosphatase [Mycobacteriales bacterium]|nr:SpoIIE family protein phosphatase [Mycobacteriales bacterium]
MTSVRRPVAVGAFVLGLAVAASAVTVGLVVDDARGPGDPAPLVLPVLALLVGLAEFLQVRFRLGRHVNGLNLVEAVLAPLLFAFAGWQAVAAVASGQAVAGLLRRNDSLKLVFNVAQWSLATALGATAVHAVGGDGFDVRGLLGVLLGLALVALVNHAAFAVVLAISNGGGVGAVLTGLAPVVLPGWLGGLAVNAAVGLLFTASYDGHPATVPVFAVPLVLLHLAYRGQAAARAERARVAGLQRAASALSQPIDPREAIGAYLHEVAATFDARLVMLVLRTDGSREVHRLERAVDGSLAGEPTVLVEGDDALSLAGVMAALPGPVEVRRTDTGPLALALAGEQGRDCLAAPLRDDARLIGALLVVDRAGFESAGREEIAIVEALAREATSAFAKGRLLATVLEERRKLDEIISSTSDGIATLDEDGTVLSWNPALERITGALAVGVVGRPGALRRLHLTTRTGLPVDLASWTTRGDLPSEVLVRGPAGPRRLACSYSTAERLGEQPTLVVVARDVTPAEEMEQLRAQFRQLVEMEAAQRVVVEHLQEAVMPPRPDVDGVELGVTYVASDPSSPTGGDLYDCQVLPTGELHLAVVDVLGHGVRATQDALAVVHALRNVVFDGTPLQDVVGRCDELLGRQDPELVATVVLARYQPTTGRLLVASGGHPPPLVVGSDGQVRQVVAHGGAIGWPGAGSDDVTETWLAPGDSLLLYTDGLVESTRDILQGLEDLAEHAGTVASLDAQSQSASLVEAALREGDRRDDTLALVLRRTVAAVVAPTARWDVGAGPEGAAAARRQLTAWLRARAVDADDAALAAGELLANAVRAARSRVELSVSLEGNRLVLQVDDDGPGLDGLPSRAVASSESGRGLHIVQAVSEDLQISGDATGTRVIAVLELRKVPTPWTVPAPATGRETSAV